MRTVGHYRLKSLIGHGATSEVYTAEHAMLGDVVAIKLLRPELAEDGAQALALVDEGAKVRAIDHPNVVRVLDAGIDPETHGCFLVMEHVAGETLSARLRREGPLVEAEVRRLGAALADGVAAAHACGIVHRDLKPANVMLDGAQPKIVDFGIAKHLGARSAVTTGRMVGTLAYMAPEQLSSGMIAPCTDVWALGVILFEAVEGHHPFDNFDDGRCPQLFDEPARAQMASPALAQILARCLARDPGRRPAADELARLLRDETQLERITVDAGVVPITSRRTLWIVATSVIVGAALGLGVLLLRDGEQPAPKPPTIVPPPVIVVQPPPPPAAPVVDAPAPEPPRAKPKRPTKKPPPQPPRETLD